MTTTARIREHPTGWQVQFERAPGWGPPSVCRTAGDALRLVELEAEKTAILAGEPWCSVDVEWTLKTGVARHALRALEADRGSASSFSWRRPISDQT